MKLEDYSEALHKMIHLREFFLQDYTTRNNDLTKTYYYLITNSGLISFLYKVKKIWGQAGAQYCIESMMEELEKYEATPDVVSWLKRHGDAYTIFEIKNVF